MKKDRIWFRKLLFEFDISMKNVIRLVLPRKEWAIFNIDPNGKREFNNVPSSEKEEEKKEKLKRSVNTVPGVPGSISEQSKAMWTTRRSPCPSLRYCASHRLLHYHLPCSAMTCRFSLYLCGWMLPVLQTSMQLWRALIVDRIGWCCFIL